jgi:hypothetical protein
VLIAGYGNAAYKIFVANGNLAEPDKFLDVE